MSEEDPDSWNNVPICIAGAVKNIKETILDADESLYEYQMCTNGRLYSLQAQLQNLKFIIGNKVVKAAQEFEGRVKKAEARGEDLHRRAWHRMDGQDSDIRANSGALDQAVAAMRQTMARSTERATEFRTQ